MQEKFMFFKNFADTIRQAIPSEKQGEAYKAICEFALYDEKPSDPMLLGMCLMAIPSLFKQDGRKNNGGNHNPQGKNQHTKEVNLGQSGQSGQFLSETETETKTETETETKKKTKKEKAEIDFSFCEDSFLKDIFLEWLEYKRQRKEAYKTQRSVEACFKLLQKLSFGIVENAREIVEQSMANNWAGLFPLKKERSGKKQGYQEKEENTEGFYWDNEIGCGFGFGKCYYNYIDYMKAEDEYLKKKGEVNG